MRTNVIGNVGDLFADDPARGPEIRASLTVSPDSLHVTNQLVPFYWQVGEFAVYLESVSAGDRVGGVIFGDDPTRPGKGEILDWFTPSPVVNGWNRIGADWQTPSKWHPPGRYYVGIYAVSEEETDPPEGTGRVFVGDSAVDAIYVIDLESNAVVNTLVSGYVPWWTYLQRASTGVLWGFSSHGEGNSDALPIDPAETFLGGAIPSLDVPLSRPTFTPNGLTALTGTSGKVQQLNLDLDDLDYLSAHDYGLTDNHGYVAVSRDGTTAAVFDDDGAYLIDVAAKTLGSQITLTDTAHRAIFSADGTKLYCFAESAGSIVIVDIGTEAVIGTIDTRDDPSDEIFGAGALSPDGARLYVARSLLGGSDCELAVIDTGGETIVADHITWTDSPTRFLISPDGERLVSDSGASSLPILDLNDETSNFASLSLAPALIAWNGGLVVATNPTAESVSVIDPVAAVETATVGLPSGALPADIEVA